MHKITFKSISFTLLLLSSVHWAYAQKEPVKFGKIDKSLLEMKVYDKDTSAAAVVLCDYGFFIPRLPQFVRVVRIKILKKEGYAWANHSFYTGSRGTIRGITYNLENGKIKKVKLKNSDIYTERVTEGIFRSRVAMPDVSVGSVIDIEFHFMGLISEWDFQETIPVVWSEMRIEPYAQFRFRKYYYGTEPLDIQSEFRWVAKDVPAFKEEPYMNSKENYITKFDFDMLSMELFFLAPNWKAISFHLKNNPNFGDALRASGYLNDIADKIEKNCSTDEEKLEAAYDSIRHIKWNHQENFFISNQNLSYTYKKGIGNSADINLALLQLIRKLGFEAYPMVMSTRDNGMLSPFYVSYKKLNYVIDYVKTDNKTYLIDATEDYMPFDLLPKKCLNYKGWLVNGDKSDWVEIEPEKKDKEVIFYNLSLDKDLSFKGKISYARFDYAAHTFRKNFHSFNSTDEYLDDYKKEKPGLRISDVDIKNPDDTDRPVNDIYDVSIEGEVNQIGDELFFNPLFYDRIDKNPFILEDRKFPVDFAYPIERKYIVTIKLPENFEVTGLPEPVLMNLPGKSASFLYQISQKDDKLMLNFTYNINKTLYTVGEYKALRQYFVALVKKNTENVIMKIK